MNSKTKIAACFTLLISLLFAAPTLSAERTITGELTVLPFSINLDKGIMNGLSTQQYQVTRQQKVAQEVGVILSFAAIDYAQSVSMFYGSGNYQELNPIFGKKPSRESMALFGVVGVGLFYLVAEYFPEPWRQIAIDSVISTERINIEDNRRVYQGWNAGGPPIRGRSFHGVPIVLSFRF